MGRMERQRASRASIHQVFPLPPQRAGFDIVREFTAEERKSLELGLLPQSTDDQWLVFFEDGWLHCHRSWSGICRYMLKIEDHPDGGAHISEAWSNTKERMTLSKDYDTRLARYLVERTLGNEWKYPT